MSINDYKNKTLAAAVGREGTTPDLELQWLMDQTGSTTIPDGWKKYLRDQGYTGSIADMLYAWTGDLGYTGSITDRLYALWKSGDIGGGNVDIDELFSADLYAGVDGTLDIVNGMDLTDADVLIWNKGRQNVSNHWMIDNVRGLDNYLYANSTQAESTATDLIRSLNSDGYTIGDSGNINSPSYTAVVNWVFKKAPKFFDLIKYTGDGILNRKIPHSLGIQAGLVIVKCLDLTTKWYIQHVDRSPAFTLSFDSSAELGGASVWNSIAATDVDVNLGTNEVTNGSGLEYIMYVFAHDPSPEGVIQCGSYTGNGENSNFVNLETPWEEGLNFLMIKSATSDRNWMMLDRTRGDFTTGINKKLFANLTFTESSTDELIETELGFELTTPFTNTNSAGDEFIYMAIRAPTPVPAFRDINELFSINLWTGTNSTRNINTGLDMVNNDGMMWGKNRDATEHHMLYDTLRGATNVIRSNTINVETVDTALSAFRSNGFTLTNSSELNRTGEDAVGWSFLKAPRFFDVIKYTGDGTNGRSISHDLGVQAGMCIVKNRTAGTSWAVQHIKRPVTTWLELNSSDGEGVFSLWGDVSMTDSSVTLGSDFTVNGIGNDYIMYVFAHDSEKDGVIQCGGYTSNGTSKFIKLGWEPQYVFFKKANTDSASWWVFDTARGISSPNDFGLTFDTTDIEVQTTAIDVSANGFTVVAQGSESGGEYIYMAIRAPE